MKYKTILIRSLIYTIFYINAFYASDNQQYQIIPFNYNRDNVEAFALVSKEFELLSTADGQKIDDEGKEFLSKMLQNAYKNNVPMSLIQIVENSFRRMVIRNQHHLVGVADFFLCAEEDQNTTNLKYNDGCIEKLLIEDNVKHLYPFLIDTVLDNLKTMGTQRAVIQFAKDKLHEDSRYKAIFENGFTEQIQSDLEKQYDIVRFQKNL